MGLCEEPGDIAMIVLDLVSKCVWEGLKNSLRVTRAIVGLAFSFAEALVVYNLILTEHFEDVAWNVEWYLGFAGVYALSVGIVLFFGISMVRNEGDKDKARRFVLAFKFINVFLALVNAAGVIVGRDELDLKEDPWQVALLVLIGVDVVLDPIEFFIACCHDF